MDDAAMLACQTVLGPHLYLAWCHFEAESGETLPQVATVEQGN